VYKRGRHILEEMARVDATVRALGAGDLGAVGRLLAASHHSSRVWFENSTAELDALVDRLVLEPAVYGARLTGGGFGGAVIALTSDRFGAAEAQAVAAAYTDRFGASPEVLHLLTGDGAELVD
jgi:galactokinase